jgi:hypothetical protein
MELPMSLEPSSLSQQMRPRLAPFAVAQRYAGVSRSRLYEWAKTRPKLLRKNGRASLVDFDELDAILNELPIAELKIP